MAKALKKTRGMKRLSQWLEQEQLSMTQAAEISGCTRVALRYILNGERGPSLRTAIAIEDATSGLRGGKVRVREWLS